MPSTSLFTRFAACLAALVVMSATSARAADAIGVSSEKEQEQLAILRSDAPSADKAIACKKLAIDGSSESVPDLAKLLSDPQLSSWARIALEVIPGAAADEALRKAAESLEGRLLVGTINSIGIRRDANAVDGLIARLQDQDADVASAAAVALGRIGNAAATKSLRQALTTEVAAVRSAVAEGCVLSAERLHADGKSDEAVLIYDEVRKADLPKQRIIEATRGAILARKQQGIPLLLEQFQSPDKKLFQLALSTAREFPGSAIDKALAAEMVKATPDRAALMIQAMADRKETVVLAAVLKAAGEGPKPVRLSAINALARVGNDACLSTLLPIALEADTDLAQAAKGTLAELPGEKVDSQIVALLAKAQGKSYPLLIELVGQRRIEATPALLKALDHSDKVVRCVALTALGETVSLKNLSVLVSQVVAPKHPDDTPPPPPVDATDPLKSEIPKKVLSETVTARQALKTASVRMPDRDACAAELSTALGKSPAAAKTVLLEILADVGGTTALKTIGTAAKSNDAQLQDVGSRLLGKWNNVDAAPVLLDLAKTAPEEKYQVRALRGYIGLVRKFPMPEQQRAEMCQKAFDVSRQPAEQKLVLDVLKLHPSIATLKLAIKTIQVPELKDDAIQATLAIAQKIGGKSPEARQLLASVELNKVKLEIVKAEYGAGATQKDVTEVLQKQAADSPLITLESASYNECFGGDPAPGSVKQLKIQYKINDKTGEASFAEDALIILPMPK
ncbi:MAG: HEAT repeat domain-containing protein [Candidatus Saccharimonas sp.]|nr:HEAT repeat domain-containing protein [Planctomycetaceae bacterium]